MSDSSWDTIQVQTLFLRVNGHSHSNNKRQFTANDSKEHKLKSCSIEKYEAISLKAICI